MMRLSLLRQIIHLVLGSLLLISYVQGLIEWWFFLGVIIFTLMVLIIIFVSGHSKIHAFIDKYEREHTYFPGWGPINLMKGFLLASLFFSKEIAIPTLIILVFGDAFATIVGMKGKYKLPWNKEKTWEGTSAGVIISFLLLLFLLTPLHASIIVFASMFIETLKKPVWLDDNMLIPLVAGLLLTIII